MIQAPHFRQLAAAVIVNALHESQYLLRYPGCLPEQLFEGFEAVVWLWSQESNDYFDAIGYEPEWARVRLPLQPHTRIALELSQDRRPMLLGLYVSTGRQVARTLHRRSTTAELEAYAAQVLEQAITVLSARSDYDPAEVLPLSLTA